MFGNDVIQLAVRLHRAGKRPSEILRAVAQLHPDATVPDLMRLMQDAFALPYTAVQCIGGWWHDGTGELSDEQLDALMADFRSRKGERACDL